MSEKEFIEECMPACRKVFAHAVKIVGIDDANDIMQECLRRLWERKNDLSEMNNVEAYTMAIGRNQIVDILHSRKRYVRDAESDVQEATSSLESDMENKEKASIVKNLLQTLPDKQRIVVEMSVVKDMDNAEIAAATGMTDVNIRQILSRGRKMLKEMYIRRTKGWIS